MQSSIAVRCQDLTKTYGDPRTGGSTALCGVDLTLYLGELTMLMGPSGCGKTTLISIIAGILNQTSGTCEVLSHNFKTMTIDEQITFRAQNLGFVFQSFNLFPTLTAAENAAIPLLIRGMDRKDAVQKAEHLLGRLGMADKCNAYPASLSGGQQQRVAIARALIHNPRLIVCDEPTSALDSQTGHTVMELLKRDVLDDNRALIVVTHDARILDFADRTAHMEDGRIVDMTVRQRPA